MDEGLPSIHHPSTVKGFNLPQTQSCHCAPHLSHPVLNIPSHGDLVPAVGDSRSLGRKKWHRVEVKSPERCEGETSLELSSLRVPGSLSITARTWIMQGQTIVDKSLSDSTPNCYSIWPDRFLFQDLNDFIQSNLCQTEIRLWIDCDVKNACSAYGGNKADIMPAYFWWWHGTSRLWFEALFGFLACCQLRLFVLAINDGAAKLLSQLNNEGLQGLMGSFINASCWPTDITTFCLPDRTVDLIRSVKMWVIIVIWIIRMTQRAQEHRIRMHQTMMDEL